MGLIVSKYKTNKSKNVQFIKKLKKLDRNSLVTEKELPSLPLQLNISYFSVEIWSIIFKHISIKDAISLLRVNIRLNRLLNSHISSDLWEALVVERFFSITNHESSFRNFTSCSLEIINYKDWGLYKMCSEENRINQIKSISRSKDHLQISQFSQFLDEWSDSYPLLIELSLQKYDLSTSYLASTIIKVHDFSMILESIISIITKDDNYHTYYRNISLENLSMQLSSIDPSYYQYLSRREYMIQKTVDIYLSSSTPQENNLQKFVTLIRSLYNVVNTMLPLGVDATQTSLEDFSMSRFYAGGCIGSHLILGPILKTLANNIGLQISLTREFFIVQDESNYDGYVLVYLHKGVIEIYNRGQVEKLLDDSNIDTSKQAEFFEDLHVDQYLEMFFDTGSVSRSLKYDPDFYYPISLGYHDQKFTKLDRGVLDRCDVRRFVISNYVGSESNTNTDGIIDGYHFRMFSLFIKIIKSETYNIQDVAEFTTILIQREPMMIDSFISQLPTKFYRLLSILQTAQALLNTNSHDSLYFNPYTNSLTNNNYKSKLKNPDTFIFEIGEIIQFQNTHADLCFCIIIEPMERILNTKTTDIDSLSGLSFEAEINAFDGSQTVIQEYLCISLSGDVSTIPQTEIIRDGIEDVLLVEKFKNLTKIGSYFTKYDPLFKKFTPNARLVKRLNHTGFFLGGSSTGESETDNNTEGTLNERENRIDSFGTLKGNVDGAHNFETDFSSDLSSLDLET